MLIHLFMKPPSFPAPALNQTSHRTLVSYLQVAALMLTQTFSGCPNTEPICVCTLHLSAWIHSNHRANKRAIQRRSNNKVHGGHYYCKEVSAQRPALSLLNKPCSPEIHTNKVLTLNAGEIRTQVEGISRVCV